MAVVAFSVTLTEPELLKNYTGLLQSVGKLPASSKGPKRTALYAENQVEASLRKYYGATTNPSAAKNAALVPDLSIESSRIADILARSFGTTAEEVVALEAKYKRGGSTNTTIGQRSAREFAPGFLDQLKLLAKQAEEEGLLKGNKDFSGGDNKSAFDVNNPAEVLRAVRAKIGGAGFFNLVKKYDPTLHKAFYNKAKNLVVTEAHVVKNKVVKVTAVNIFFPFKNFTSPPFQTELGSGSENAKRAIVYKLSSSFEKQLLKRLEESGPPIVARNVEEFQKVLSAIDGKRKMGKIDFGQAPALDYSLLLGVPSGSSIPRLNARVKKSNMKSREVVKNTSQFISSAQLTQILRARIQDKMPTVGEPNPTEGLKYRTGRFVNALQFMVDYRKALISYYAEPPVDEYFDKFHRRPYAVGQRLIRPTIRQTVQELFGRQFKIIKT